MKKSRLLFVACLSFLLSNAIAQTHTHSHTYSEHIHTTGSCGYTDAEIELLLDKGLNFRSNQEAVAVVNDIMSTVGLISNFKVQAAKVPNAAAVIYNNERYVLYDPKFIQSVKDGTETNWSAISIMAHEIGHHLNGHTLNDEGSRPDKELEADEFSGYVLRKMGATVAQAQAAMALLANPYGTATHPARDRRLKAIANGWNRADEIMGSSTGSAPDIKPSSNTNSSSSKHPTFARWSIKLYKNPNGIYYVTNSNKFVIVKNKKVVEVGSLKKTTSKRFPFVIEVANSPNLYISTSGKLLTEVGVAVGELAKL